jgi:hypothetical protein
MLCGAHVPVGLFLPGSISRGEAPDHRYGPERQWDSRHGTRAARQHQHGHEGIKKKEPDLQSVNQAVLAYLNPEQVAVEICRADELEQRRGLTSELDEMWSSVATKANPRWLWHAIDHHSGKV